MRVIVMGTGPFALPSADGLLADGYDIPLVVTRPTSAPAQRKVPVRPMAEWAARHRIALFEPASINAEDAIEVVRSYNTDLFFVCDYGQILSKACLAASRLGGINLHGSILPRHRGAAPVQWTLLSGDTKAGVTVILMTPKLDAGPALAVRATEVLPDETAGQLELRLAELGVEATRESLRQLSSWDGAFAIGQVQDNSLATKAPRFQKQHGQLDFRLPAEYLVRLVRACQPWPGTYADLQISAAKQIRLLVRSARAIASESNSTGGIFAPNSAAGSIAVVSSLELGLDWQSDWRELLAVQTSNGLFLINRVQPAGKREMTVAEFARGQSFGAGAHFLLPLEPAVCLTKPIV